jgi:hypothetical protein
MRPVEARVCIREADTLRLVDQYQVLPELVSTEHRVGVGPGDQRETTISKAASTSSISSYGSILLSRVS